VAKKPINIKAKRQNFSQDGNNKMAVVGMVQRTGKVVLEYISKSNIANIRPLIDKYIDLKSTTLNTDETTLYKGYERQTVNHSKGEYVRGKVHTNTIEDIAKYLQSMYSMYGSDVLEPSLISFLS
jgi:Tfp pilus assembly ATPase PilU